MKKLLAIVLSLCMAVSCMVMSVALTNPFEKIGDAISDNIPTGSNLPDPDEYGKTDEDKQSSDEDSDSQSALGRFGNGSFGSWFIPTAPDEVKEAFGVADEAYAAEHQYCFAVNTSQNIVIAYVQDEDGVFSKPEKAFVCSCGLSTSPTKKGLFRTSDTYRWRLLNGGVYGQWATRISGPYLFHSVPYTAKDPSTLETAEYNKLGENASAGCVRLTVKDAKWIQKNCPAGTIVYIYDGSDVREPLSKPSAQKINPSSPYAGWDPTDPNENNPWNA